MEYLKGLVLPCPAEVLIRLDTERELARLAGEKKAQVSSREETDEILIDRLEKEGNLAKIRGIVWSADAQTGLVILFVPPHSSGGSTTQLPWTDNPDSDCKAIVLQECDIVCAPTLIHDAGHPLHQWWNSITAGCTETPHSKQSENPVVSTLAEYWIPAELAEESVIVFDGLAKVNRPFNSADCIECEDEELRNQLALLLFDVPKPTQVQGKDERKRNNSKKNKNQKKSRGQKETGENKVKTGVLLHLGTDVAGTIGKVYRTRIHLEKYSAYMTRRIAPKHTGPPPEEYKDVPFKYFTQRYRLFSKFDHGIQMDLQSWYSVTPETIAEHIAERCRANVVLDVFGGCGGNAIQFAFTCERVIFVEIDPKRIEIARNNARVYGVEERIEFIQADGVALLQSLGEQLSSSSSPSPSLVDVVFLSPPWGGPEYQKAEHFDLKSIQVKSSSSPDGFVDGVELYRLALRVSPDVAFFMPRNTDPLRCHEQCSTVCNSLDVEFEEHVVDDRLKTCCIYCGDLLAKRTLKLL